MIDKIACKLNSVGAKEYLPLKADLNENTWNFKSQSNRSRDLFVHTFYLHVKVHINFTD